MGEKHNLIINGSGSYGGGSFHKVIIRGDGTITSDFDCEIFKAYGSSDVLKDAKARKFSVHGESEVQGNLKADEMKILGNTTVGGSASIEKVKVWGTLDVGGRFSGEHADIKGTLSVKGDAEFESFSSTGVFEITGLLNAGTVKINPRFGSSFAEEIGGENIIVKRKTSLFTIFSGEGHLKARLIEGDDIFLENTSADVVRGKRIYIGTGCEVGLVEYQEEFNADPNALVKEHTKVG
jgi:cytoskeletal protein CcmA (bactofilin family)